MTTIEKLADAVVQAFERFNDAEHNRQDCPECENDGAWWECPVCAETVGDLLDAHLLAIREYKQARAVRTPEAKPEADVERNSDYNLGFEDGLAVGYAALKQEAAPDVVEAETVSKIAAMMAEFVDNWPPHKRLDTSLKLVAETIRSLLDPPKHQFWGAGEPDCPREIKAGNGELHTLRRKVCGQDNPRDGRCFARIDAALESGRE